jgi:hypothetical protein
MPTSLAHRYVSQVLKFWYARTGTQKETKEPRYTVFAYDPRGPPEKVAENVAELDAMAVYANCCQANQCVLKFHV